MQLKVEMFWKAGAQAKKGRDRFFFVIRKMLRILNYGKEESRTARPMLSNVKKIK